MEMDDVSREVSLWAESQCELERMRSLSLRELGMEVDLVLRVFLGRGEVVDGLAAAVRLVPRVDMMRSGHG